MQNGAKTFLFWAVLLLVGTAVWKYGDYQQEQVGVHLGDIRVEHTMNYAQLRAALGGPGIIRMGTALKTQH